jgi:hypothetical protein
MNPNFPVYIVSKGRADSRLTVKALQAMQVPFYVVIEEQEFRDYAAVIDARQLLILEKRYQRDYDTCDALGDSKGKGPGPARNFAWEHSIRAGHAWHWVMDDNIRDFYRMNRNKRIRVADGTIFRCMEDFCLRYRNVAMAGPVYRFLLNPREPRSMRPPFIANTRIYSCNLIRNDVPFRWRGRYNEDTDLSLRMLKAHWCTVQFNAFMQEKMRTQTIRGGNTDEFYAREGTLPKSQMLVALHPDVTKLVWKFGRAHHHVDYRPFARNQMLRAPHFPSDVAVNEYGLQILDVGDGRAFDESRRSPQV